MIHVSIYSFTAKTIDGQNIALSTYQGKVLLIVNTASRCGFTPQYEELQSLYTKYQSAGLEILAFPCNQFMNQEPGTDQQIQSFCQTHYGVTFPLFSKVDVKGENAHPLFKYLTQQTSGFMTEQIKWNFTKFLVNRKGEVVGRYAPTTSPKKMEKEILSLLEEPVEETTGG